MSSLQRVLVYSAAWAGFGVISGWLAPRIPSRWLGRDRGPLRLRGWEHRGRWYDRHLKLRRWKDRLPDAGGLFRGGRSKASVLGFDSASLRQFAIETRRAEWVHWANIGFGVTFLTWTERRVALMMIAFGLVAHLPFIAVQRYNRAKATWILDRRGGTARTSAIRRSPLRRAAGWLAMSTTAALVVLAVLALWRVPARPVSMTEAHEAARDLGVGEGGGRELIPPEGVYDYRGEGTERLDRFPGSTQQGPLVPGTVVHTGDGCWTFRVDYHSKHWQSWDFCVRDGRLEERGGAAEQQLDLVAIEVTASSRTTCPAGVVAADPAARPGDEAVQTCDVESSAADTPLRTSGRSTFVGRESIDVGGHPVETLHHRRERDITGAQRGVERLDVWFDASTGLPVRNERSVELRTDTPIGSLTYTESGSYSLASATPERAAGDR